jgi:hypothetical protein
MSGRLIVLILLIVGIASAVLAIRFADERGRTPARRRPP